VRSRIAQLGEYNALVASNEFRQSEIENFSVAFRSNNDILRFHIAVDDPAIVSRSESRGYLVC
jgi:hypothetical protein